MAVARRKRVLWWKFRDASKKLWTVWLVHRLVHDGRRLRGLTNYDRRCVYIEYSSDYTEMSMTMWHEWVHVACGHIMNDHPEFALMMATEESTVCRAERGLHLMAQGAKFHWPEIPDEAALLAA